MKNNFKSFVFISIFTLCLSIPCLIASQELPFDNPNLLISMDFQNASLKDILKIFSIQSGLNFVASEGVKDRTLTLYFDKVPIKDAMDKLFRANNLSYELDPDSSIFIVKDWGKPGVELVTKVFYLKYARVSSSHITEEVQNHLSSMAASSGTSTTTSTTSGSSGDRYGVAEDIGITTAVKKLLSKDGSVIEDYRTNSLIVQDIPSHIPAIAQAIAALDVPTPQVLIEVEMLDVSKNIVDKLGINWASAGSFSMRILGAAQQTRFPLYSMSAPLSGLTSMGGRDQKFTPGDITFPTALQPILDYLRRQTDTRYLARPRLLTLNNETAEIKIVTQESIGITSTVTAATATTSTTVERAETGVLLRVTPQINMETGEITMFIYPQVSEATAGNVFTSGTAGSFQYRDPEVRSTKSVVRLSDGDTIIVGGLIRNEFLKTTTSVPFLSNIPLIGALFRHKGGGDASTAGSDKNKERELLVFITPHIIRDKNIELAQAKQTKLPEREQNTVSVVDRQAAINTSLSNFEKNRKY